MPQFADPTTFEAMLWNKIHIPELRSPEFAAKNPSLSAAAIDAIESGVKKRFINALLQNARPEQTEFIMHQAMKGQYDAYITVHAGADHLHDSVRARQAAIRAGGDPNQPLKLQPFDPKGSAGALAAGDHTVNALDIVDSAGRLKVQPDAKGNIVLGEQNFERRVVHETAHIVDQNHKYGAYQYSENSPAFIEARTSDRFHAGLMKDVQETMAENLKRTGKSELTVRDMEVLETKYQQRKAWYDSRVADAPRDDHKTFLGRKNELPATMDEYFKRLPEKNGVISENMGKLLAEKPALAGKPAKAYMELLQKQYDEFGGIKGERAFVEQLGVDVKENVRNRVVEIDYYSRENRVGEAFAKATDALDVNLNHARKPLPNGRNPLGEMLLPNMGEHLEVVVYEDLHKNNLEFRKQLESNPKFKQAQEALWREQGLDPKEQMRLIEEADTARKSQGAKASNEQKALQAQRRRDFVAIEPEAIAGRMAAGKPVNQVIEGLQARMEISLAGEHEATFKPKLTITEVKGNDVTVMLTEQTVENGKVKTTYTEKTFDARKGLVIGREPGEGGLTVNAEGKYADKVSRQQGVLRIDEKGQLIFENVGRNSSSPASSLSESEFKQFKAEVQKAQGKVAAPQQLEPEGAGKKPQGKVAGGNAAEPLEVLPAERPGPAKAPAKPAALPRNNGFDIDIVAPAEQAPGRVAPPVKQAAPVLQPADPIPVAQQQPVRVVPPVKQAVPVLQPADPIPVAQQQPVRVVPPVKQAVPVLQPADPIPVAQQQPPARVAPNKPAGVTPPTSGKPSGLSALANAEVVGGAMGAAFGGLQLYNGIKHGDLMDGALGVTNIGAGAVAIAANTSRGATAMGASAGTVGKAAGGVLLAAGVVSIGYEAYKEQGTGKDDKLAYQIARGASGATSMAAGMAAGHFAAKVSGSYGWITAPIAGIAVGMGTAMLGNKLIEDSKAEKIAAKAKTEGNDGQKTTELQDAIAKLSRTGSKTGITNEDIYPDGKMGRLALASFSDKDGKFGAPELKALHEKAEAALKIAKLTGNEVYTQLAASLQALENMASKRLGQLASLQGKDPSINTREIANEIVVASGAARAGSVMSSNAERAGRGAMATADPGQPMAQVSSAQQVTVARVQNVGQGQMGANPSLG